MKNSPLINGQAGIPKRIIHIYCQPPGTARELPLLYRAAIASAQSLNPDFEHLLFDNAKFEALLADEPAEHRRAINAFQYPIQKYDFFRLLAIHRLGGIYMDLDVILARSLTPLLACEAVFPFEELTVNSYLRKQYGVDWEIGNYAFGAQPGHPLIAAMIENCLRSQRDPAWVEPMWQGIPGLFRNQFAVVNTTGPGLATRTLAENPALHNRVTVLFPDDVCDETTWHRFGDYGVHLMHSSWRSRDGFLKRRLARLWEGRRRSRLLKESQRLGPRRAGAWQSSFPPTATAA